MQYRIAALALLLPAACGRDVGTHDAEVAAEPAIEVSAVDQFGPADGAVSGLAMWAHPTLPFNGLVIAVGEAGLVAWNVEDGAEVTRDAGEALEGVSVAYLGKGPDAQGYVATRAVSDEPRYNLYAIDNVSRELSLVGVTTISERAEARGFCLGRPAAGDGLALYEMTARGWRSTALTIGDSAISSGPADPGDHKGGFTRCIVDDLDGAVFAITAKGQIYRVENGVIGTAPLAATGIENPASIGLALNGLVDGTPEGQCCGQLAVLDGASGVVRLFDREDGHSLGAVRLTASFDVEAVASASALGLGYGNYGAVYRDGIVALATAGDGDSAIRLTPLNGVMDALAQPLGEAANPRDLSPQEEGDLVIDIELVKP